MVISTQWVKTGYHEPTQNLSKLPTQNFQNWFFDLKVPWNGDNLGIIFDDFKSSTNLDYSDLESIHWVSQNSYPLKFANMFSNGIEWPWKWAKVLNDIERLSDIVEN